MIITIKKKVTNNVFQKVIHFYKENELKLKIIPKPSVIYGSYNLSYHFFIRENECIEINSNKITDEYAKIYFIFKNIIKEIYADITLEEKQKNDFVEFLNILNSFKEISSLNCKTFFNNEKELMILDNRDETFKVVIELNDMIDLYSVNIKYNELFNDIMYNTSNNYIFEDSHIIDDIENKIFENVPLDIFKVILFYINTQKSQNESIDFEYRKINEYLELTLLEMI